MSDFERIFKKYHLPLFLYARKFVENEDLALDLVQDVFMTLWEKKRMDMNEEYLKAFLFHALRNNCLNHLKHEAVIQKHKEVCLASLALTELEYYKSGEQSLIEKEDKDKIDKAISSLSTVHREVIELSRFEGLKNKEIAERLNIPLRTVETRLFRALSALRSRLSEKTFVSLFFWKSDNPEKKYILMT